MGQESMATIITTATKLRLERQTGKHTRMPLKLMGVADHEREARLQESVQMVNHLMADDKRANVVATIREILRARHAQRSLGV